MIVISVLVLLAGLSTGVLAWRSGRASVAAEPPLRFRVWVVVAVVVTATVVIRLFFQPTSALVVACVGTAFLALIASMMQRHARTGD